MRTLLFTIFASVAFTACGYSSLEKDKERAEDRARTSEQKNEELESYIDVLQLAFSNTVASSNSIWVTVQITHSHAIALKNCDDINMSLATKAELAEFKSEIYDHDANLQKIAFEKFYAKDVAVDQSEMGVILCRKGRLERTNFEGQN